MKLRKKQPFLPFQDEPYSVEVATGEARTSASTASWSADTVRLGQVATPAPIARLMAKWVMSAKPRTVLDPAVGLGGLLTVCQEFDHCPALIGVDRDDVALRRAVASAPRGTKLILSDYLRFKHSPVDGIIANPPYVKAHRLDYSESDWRDFEDQLGIRLDRLTNLYALFLLKIWEDLTSRGRAAVILPAEFLNANFGEEIKQRLVSAIRPTALMVFAPSVNLFNNALTTSAIVFLDKARCSASPSLVRRVDSVEEATNFLNGLLSSKHLQIGDCLDLSKLDPREKWLNLILNGVKTKTLKQLPNRVGDYFDCRRGIATGANDYFCLSRSTLRQNQLSKSHVEPCITKAVDATGLVFNKEKFEVLTQNDRRCFLLNPSCNGQELTLYLKLGEQRGIPYRHLPSHRPIWYLPENRDIADIWVAVFSRENAKFILNTSEAKNLTCFHGLYAKPGNEPMPPLMTLFLNSSNGRQAFSQVNRFYGDGLNKLEPKDVEAMPCPSMPELNRREADRLTRRLIELEQLPLVERTTRIDDVAKHYFG